MANYKGYLKDKDGNSIVPSHAEKFVVDTIKCKNEFNINKVLEAFYVNYSINGDNITITSAGAYANIRVLVDVEMGKEYTLSCSAINNQDVATNISVYKKNSSDRYVEQYGYGTTPSFNLTFTPTENQIVIMFYANPTPDGYFNTVNYNNIQLEQGTITEYTPHKKYGYNSQESMGKIIADDISCKNLFNFNNMKMSYATVDYTKKTITFTSFNNATLNNLKDICPDLVVGETYTFSFKTTSTVKYIYLNGSKYTWNNNGAHTITQEDLDGYILFYGATDTSCTMSDIQIEKGTIATEYTPHKEFNNKQIYSTNEQIIGTWINDKPLYRKVVSIVLSDVTDDTIVNIRVNHNIQNMEYGWVELATRLLSNNSDIYTYGSSGYINAADRRIQWFLNTEQLSASMNRSVDNGTWYVSLCYTKTTD